MGVGEVGSRVSATADGCVARQESAIVPVTSTSRGRPVTVTVAVASSLSSPRRFPASSCSRTASSISRCAVTPSVFRNLRTDRFKVSSSLLASFACLATACGAWHAGPASRDAGGGRARAPRRRGVSARNPWCSLGAGGASGRQTACPGYRRSCEPDTESRQAAAPPRSDRCPATFSEQPKRLPPDAARFGARGTVRS